MTGKLEVAPTGMDDGRREALAVKVSRSEQMLFGDFARIVRHAGNAAESAQSATMVAAEYVDEGRKYAPEVSPEPEGRLKEIHTEQDALVAEAWRICGQMTATTAEAQARLAEIGMRSVRLSTEWLEEVNRDAEAKRVGSGSS